MDKNNFHSLPGEYRPESNLYRIYYEEEDCEPVSTVIVKAVAALTNTPPIELDPLYETINPGALNRLSSFDPQDSQQQTDSHITFTYNECQITVFWIGILEIEPPIDSELGDVQG